VGARSGSAGTATISTSAGLRTPAPSNVKRPAIVEPACRDRRSHHRIAKLVDDVTRDGSAPGHTNLETIDERGRGDLNDGRAIQQSARAKSRRRESRLRGGENVAAGG
jgi:hypothetical protein